MIARDLTLSSLYAARDQLGALIVRWGPSSGSQPETLHQLLLARDQVSAAINAVIAVAFRDLPSPELLAAAKELSATTARLQSFGQSIAQVNEVLNAVEQAVSLAAKVIALAG